jgi:hypothetical protein
VAHAVLDALPDASVARLGGSLLNLFPVVGMNLFKAEGFRNLIRV